MIGQRVSVATTDVVVTGESGGGFGAAANYDTIASHFPNNDVVVIDDSGPIFTDTYLEPCLQQQWRDVWNIDASLPHGPVPYFAYLLLVGVLAGLFTHHTRRSVKGRLLRVQLVSLALLFVLAIVVKALMLTTSISVLVIPVALFAMVPTLVLDRVVGQPAPGRRGGVGHGPSVAVRRPW